jgi:hypothetical protein
MTRLAGASSSPSDLRAKCTASSAARNCSMTASISSGGKDVASGTISAGASSSSMDTKRLNSWPFRVRSST